MMTTTLATLIYRFFLDGLQTKSNEHTFADLQKQFNDYDYD